MGYSKLAERLFLKQRQNHYSSRRAVDTKNKKIVKFYRTLDNWRNRAPICFDSFDYFCFISTIPFS